MIFYICDREQCENCHDECKHTTDIKHSVNYKERGGPAFLDKFRKVTILDATDFWEENDV